MEIGGKGRHLRELEAAGLAVPRWYAVPPDVADEDLRAFVEARHFPGDPWVAVRSSAVGEDGAAHSFAGVHESFLYVRDRAAVVDAVRRVRASAHTGRARAYRRERGLPAGGVAVAVLVQKMVHPRTSGVAFTANPVSGDVHEIVVSALWGVGEGLVSRGFDADRFVVAKRGLALKTRDVAVKREEMALDDGRLAEREVAAERRERASLTDEEVQAVARAAVMIERRLGRPQDLEFAFDRAGRLWLLQTRPVTTVEEYGPAAGRRILWDNSNIAESYSGVTTPLTFSFIRHAYASVYESFCGVMGVPASVIAAHRPMFRNMLGLLRGQVYYNLVHWYRLVGLFPGFRFNRGFLESMMGVKEGLAGDDLPRAAGFWRRYLVELPALAGQVVRSTWRFARLDRHVARFERGFRANHARFERLDFERLAPGELMDLYDEMQRAFLDRWQTPIVNDFHVMVFYGTLKKLCASWLGDADGSLQNDLLSGEGGIESTEPARMLVRLAALARADARLKERILTDPPERLAAEIPADPRFAGFAAELERYLARYGFRCMGELKLEEHSLRERPAFVYQVLRNYVARPPAPVDPGAIRAAAEKRVAGTLRGWRRSLFGKVLANARRGVRHRENMRFARSRVFALVRRLFRALGGHLAREGVLVATDDVFYLTVEEIRDYVQGTAVTADLAGLVALRRAEFDRYRAADAPDDRFETFGMPYHRNLFRHAAPAAAPTNGALRGIGCCPGRVAGLVKVIRAPTDDMTLDGEILVAGRTDPGWVPLYPSARGLLLERGSILSHAAIVAREMGIPTIVGIPGLLDRLETGQHVEMDGAAGTVTCATRG